MGYDTETNYNFGYFSFLNPYQIRFNMIARGLAFPEIGPDFNACELGFGNGVSIVMHAVNSSVNWYGNDFNPAQVSFAQMLADTAHTKVHLSDDAFDQFLEREDLPMFDYICLHGIFSWISEENRDIIVEFIKRHLKIGGVVYISYNVHAGFGNTEPFRYLMYSYIHNFGDKNKSHVQNIPQALDFIDKLIELSPAYTQNAPWAKEHYHSRIVKQNHNYVAHEFLNSNWFIEDSHDIATLLEPAKLNFVGQACLVDDFNELSFSQEELEFLAQYEGTALYQSVRDYVMGQLFRRDLFVKGAISLNEYQKIAELDKTYFLLVQNKDAEQLTINTRIGTQNVDLKRIDYLLKFMSDYDFHSFKEMREALSIEHAKQKTKHLVPVSRLIDDLTYAQGTGILLVTVPPEHMTQNILANSHELNMAILNSHLPAQLTVLSAPALGGAFVVEEVHKFLLSIVLTKPETTEDDLTCYLMTFLSETGNTFKYQGRTIAEPKEQLPLVRDMIHDFVAWRLPTIRKLCCI